MTVASPSRSNFIDKYSRAYSFTQADIFGGSFTMVTGQVTLLET
jgi:hypothetical protein